MGRCNWDAVVCGSVVVCVPSIASITLRPCLSAWVYNHHLMSAKKTLVFLFMYVLLKRSGRVSDAMPWEAYLLSMSVSTWVSLTSCSSNSLLSTLPFLRNLALVFLAMRRIVAFPNCFTKNILILPELFSNDCLKFLFKWCRSDKFATLCSIFNLCLNWMSELLCK